MQVYGRADCIRVKAGVTGTAIAGVSQKFDVNQQSFFRWTPKFAGMGIAEACRLKQLEEESRNLKMLVADLSPDKAMLQDAQRRKL